MPSCNLAESIHNKWSQVSGNKGRDLYVGAVDDYVRAFLQVLGCHQFNKGGASGSGPSVKELRERLDTVQRRANRSGNPSCVNKAAMDFLEAEAYCIHDAYLEGAEVPIGAEDKS